MRPDERWIFSLSFAPESATRSMKPVGGRAMGSRRDTPGRVRVFFFGVGYCARRLIQRERGIEASGTARSDERAAALRAEGVEAYVFDGARADPGVETAIERAEAVVGLDPAARGRRKSVRAICARDRRCAGAAAHPLLLDHRRLRRPWGRLGRRDQHDGAALRSGAGPARGRGALGRGGPVARRRRGYSAACRNLRPRPQCAGET